MDEDYNIEMLAEQPWEETIDFLTRDMPADNIDIKVLAERYQNYLNEMQDYDLAVPARAIRVCSALLNLKAAITLDYEEELDEEDQPENPMDFEEEELIEEEQEDEVPDLEAPPELEMPVRPKPKRRMQKSELKDALRDAMEVKERREERQEERQEMDEQFEFQEETLQDKINSLYSTLKGFVSSKSGERVHFNKLLDEDTNEERIEKFMHVLNLENDKKVRVIQEEFLGDLHVKPEDQEEEESSEKVETEEDEENYETH
jgi:chromatin segregation and condensation protein Rec8/ScpA/Scc1 (kleisin family)